MNDMVLRAMVSSVTKGLAAERRAVKPLIRALGYQPVLFEDFTAQPDPPRAVCLRALEESDIYLLLLGEFYGEPYPDTGRSPTHEEWNVATTTGKPIVAFTKRGVTPEPAQQVFMREVQDYRSGVFRNSFDDVSDLLDKLGDALEVARRHAPSTRLAEARAAGNGAVARAASHELVERGDRPRGPSVAGWLGIAPTGHFS